ncbi:MAG: LVIVD repeat-containing protein, partial [Rhodopirellula sp. JB053]
ILVGAGTLLDGNPLNNFLERALTFNPDGILDGAESVSIVGTYAYVCCKAGLVVVDLDDPTCPHVTHVIGHEELHHPHKVAVQFRYGLVTDEHGIKVIDTTDLSHPHVVHEIPLDDAHGVYIARTYAYVAAGHHGLAIIDFKKPREAFIDQVYNANGCINDAHDVKLGITNVSQFAYVADGKNGLRVVQLTSPEVPGNDGFSPRPLPYLVATYKLPKEGHALAISRGIDRDRAVDESGNQIAVFGRVGARPLSREEARRMYLRPDGQPWYVTDHVMDETIYRIQPTK